MIVLAVALLATQDPVRIFALRAGTLDRRTALTVLTAGDPGDVEVRREGNDVVLSIAGEAAPGLSAPAAAAPIESVTIERAAGGVTLRVRVAPEVPYEVRRDGTLLSVLFGEERPADLTAPPVAPDVLSLYRSILPPPSGDEAGGQLVAGATGEAAKASEPEREGLELGPVSVRPSLSATFVDAETTVNGPKPVRDTYYQVQPELAAEATLGNGRLTGSYQARLRRGSAFSVVGETSHLLAANLELPLGSGILLRGFERFTRGALETNEVDPGGEYFFNLGRFSRNEVGASARIETGGPTDLDVGGSLTRVRFDGPAGFFDYDARRIDASLGLEIAPNLRAALTYGFERIPPSPARPQAESRSNTVGLSLRGEIVALLTGQLTAAFQDRKNPNAGAGGAGYRGVAASFQLERELGHSSKLALSGGRFTRLSSFEQNGFYVSSVATARLSFALPLSLACQASGGYDKNVYRVATAALGVPRSDRILGWSVGLGRPIARWAYVRADYRRDRRTSNLELFQTRTSALTIQAAVGVFGTRERGR